MTTVRLSPYQRIVQAAKAGRGVRLSVDETAEIAQDDAIKQVAERDDREQREHELMEREGE